MTNIKIKKEEEFKELYKKFIDISDFRAKFDEFKKGILEKREWVNERSEKWHNVDENHIFNSHLAGVEEFLDNLESNMNELEGLEYPETNE